MLGIDTNILAYARLAYSPWHQRASAFLESLFENSEVVICEQTLVELYLLLRNEKIISPPLGSAEAVAECDLFRRHPLWRLVDAADVMEDVWPLATTKRISTKAHHRCPVGKNLTAARGERICYRQHQRFRLSRISASLEPSGGLIWRPKLAGMFWR